MCALNDKLNDRVLSNGFKVQEPSWDVDLGEIEEGFDGVIVRTKDEGAWYDAGSSPGTAYEYDLAPSVSYRLRVQSVDSDGRVSAWCVPSEPYIYGIPGVPTVGGGSGCWIGTRVD